MLLALIFLTFNISQVNSKFLFFCFLRKLFCLCMKFFLEIFLFCKEKVCAVGCLGYDFGPVYFFFYTFSVNFYLRKFLLNCMWYEQWNVIVNFQGANALEISSIFLFLFLILLLKLLVCIQILSTIFKLKKMLLLLIWLCYFFLI